MSGDGWQESPLQDADLMARFALDGHPDDVRTTIGLMVVLAGFIDHLKDFIGSPENVSDPVKLQALARAWDGLDGAEEIPKVREAVVILARRAEAIPRG